MSASGINPAWHRSEFILARICPCDPTEGQSCRLCDGTDRDEYEIRRASREGGRRDRNPRG